MASTSWPPEIFASENTFIGAIVTVVTCSSGMVTIIAHQRIPVNGAREASVSAGS